MNKPDVVDADTHVLEPPSMWRDYADPGIRDLVPFIERTADGRHLLRNIGSDAYDQAARQGVERSVAEFGTPSIGHAAAFGSQWSAEPIDVDYEAVIEGRDPAARLRLLDRQGVTATALYPTLGLLLGGYRDATLAAAVYRAFNRWLSEFCSEDRKRLWGAAMIPLQEPDLAIAELELAVEELELPIVTLRPNPYGGRMLHDPAHDRFWERVQDYGVAVSIHSGSADDMPTVAMDRLGDTMTTRHLTTHTMETMLAMASIIFRGPADRHPRIRFGFFEGGGGWVPGWLDRMDRHYEKAYVDVELSRRPSEIFAEQCWVCFDPAERSLPWAARHIGTTQVLWATDYPHPDGVPDGIERVRSSGLTSEEQSLVLGANARRFYGRPR